MAKEWKRAGIYCAIAAVGFAAMIYWGPTFGNRCAQAYERGSEKWELCVQRLENGHGVKYIIRKEIVPVE